MIKRFVKVKTSFKGTHNWPECPYDEVAFLRDPHRHTFHVRLTVEVTHHDRDIEFFMLQMEADAVLKKLYGNEPIRHLGRRSCEQIAEELYDGLSDKVRNFPATSNGETQKRKIVIEVSEDNEVSAVVEFE